MKFLFRVTVSHTFGYDFRGHNRTERYMVNTTSIEQACRTGYLVAKHDRRGDPSRERVLRVIAVKEWGRLDA